MKFGSNVLFSAAAHAIFIAAALFLAGRGAVYRAPARYVVVTLVNVEGKGIDKTPSAAAPGPAASSSKPVTSRGVHRQARVKTLKSHRERHRPEVLRVSAPAPEQINAASKAPPPRIRQDVTVRHKQVSRPVAEDINSWNEGGEFKAHIKAYPGAKPSGEIDRAGTASASDALSLPPVVGTGRDDGTGYSESGAEKNSSYAAIGEIRAAIERARRYPILARERGIEGTVTTEFSINTGGLPKNIRIKASSGFDILDSAAKETIIRAAPFPVVKGTIEVPIRFRLGEKEQ